MALARFLPELAVSDFDTNAVYILNKTFQQVAKITKKIRTADGIHYDDRGTLYVANSTGSFITEYNTNRRLTFTYSMGLTAAVDVTVDGSRNVYVADFGPNLPSVVVEYPQHRNVPSATCSTGLANDGIAVDPDGNVFVSGFDENAHVGRLLEYAGGLAGASPRRWLQRWPLPGGSNWIGTAISWPAIKTPAWTSFRRPIRRFAHDCLAMLPRGAQQTPEPALHRRTQHQRRSGRYVSSRSHDRQARCGKRPFRTWRSGNLS